MFKLIFNSLKNINLFVNKDKKRLFYFAILSLFLLFAPTHTVHAFFSPILDPIMEGLEAILNIPFNIAILFVIVYFLFNFLSAAIISALVYIITVILARWIIFYAVEVAVSPSSTGISSIIQTGWNFTSGFVNMFFALTLTFIGLATILGLKDYEAKKLLPKILLIAVLVNFTPVIIGFVVDMGNLVTSFFIEKTNFSVIDELVNHTFSLFDIDGIADYIVGSALSLTSGFLETLMGAISLIIGLFISTIYVWGATYVYACITGMFFLRIVMLWILTILSPIAFFSYVFPKGSTFRMLFPDVLSWEKWWEEFLKWVIVGIPFGLFLYISQAIIAADTPLLNTSGLVGIDASWGEHTIGFTDLMVSIAGLISHITGLMVLYLGYKISLDAAPAMAKSMVQNTQKLIKTGVMAVATAGVGAVAGAGAMEMGNMASGLTSFSTEAAKGGVLSKALGKGAGGLSKVMRKGEMKLAQTAIRAKPKLPKEAGEMSDQQLFDGSEGAVTSRPRAEWWSKIKDWGKISKEDKDRIRPTMEAMMRDKIIRSEYSDTFRKMSRAGISSESIKTRLSDNPEEVKRAIDVKTEEIKENMTKDVKLKGEIETAMEVRGIVSEEGKKQFKRDLAAQVLDFEELKPGDLKDLGKDGITSLAARLGSHKLGGSKLKSIRSNYGDAVADKLFTGVGGINETFTGEDGYKELMEKNEKLARYLLTNTEGITFGWNQLENKDFSDGKKIDYKKLKDEYTKYKQEKEARLATTTVAQEIEIDPAEIAKRTKEVREERIRRADEKDYQFNGKFVDQLLKNVGIKPGSSESEAFMKKWDKTKATKQLISREKIKEEGKIIDKERENHGISASEIASIAVKMRADRRSSQPNSKERKEVQGLLSNLGLGAGSVLGRAAIKRHDKSKASAQLINRKKIEKIAIALDKEKEGYGIDEREINSMVTKIRTDREKSPPNSEERKEEQALLLTLGLDAESGRGSIIQNDSIKATRALIRRKMVTEESYGGGLKASEIKKKAGEIRQERIDLSNNDDYRFNAKFVDQLLKNVEIKPGSNESKEFMKKWDKARAIEGLQKTRLKKRSLPSKDLMKNLSPRQSTRMRIKNKEANKQIEEIQRRIQEMKKLEKEIRETKIENAGTSELAHNLDLLGGSKTRIEGEIREYEEILLKRDNELKSLKIELASKSHKKIDI